MFIQKKNYTHIGILSAMPEEIGIIINNLKYVEKSIFGDLELFSGELIINESNKVCITVAWSGWGKVSAARATTRLLSIVYKKKPIDIILFTGVAGAVDTKLKKWDIVFGESLIQHDMDASPLFEKYVIPAINEKKINPNKKLLSETFNYFSHELSNGKIDGFGSIYKGLIATGDIFISERKVISKLSKEIKGLLAVEMEGAAFAQVAEQEKIDWLVIRVISDNANEEAGEEFSSFLEKYKFKSFDLIRCFIHCISA